MSKSNALENSLMLLLFNNTDIATIGDAAGIQNSVAAGSLFISLHTADPGEAGTQATSETAYTSYARVAVARSGAGWTVTGNAVTNAALISFPTSTGGSSTVTHFGIGAEVSGATLLLYSAALDASLVITTGVTPQFAAGAIDGTED